MVGGMCARTLDEANMNTAEDPLDLIRIDDDPRLEVDATA
jgi:hypothetical protein